MSPIAALHARALVVCALAVQAQLLAQAWRPAGALASLPVHGQGLQVQRALHTRLALADAVAIATVDAVGVGRIRVREAAPLEGDPGRAFELKRAPSRPPSLTAGDRALLLLRGARPPFVLVDEPHETIALADADAEARWTRAALAARGRPAQLLELYLTWLAQPDGDLRAVALAGLRDPRAPFQPLPAVALGPVVELAVDPKVDEGLRRDAGLVALGSDAGQRALLARLPGAGRDPVFLRHALYVGASQDVSELRPAILRTLRHGAPAIRRIGLEVGGPTWRDPELRSELERLADADPDPDVRSLARRLLERAAAEGAGPSRASDGANR